jgi:hypothetical protein
VIRADVSADVQAARPKGFESFIPILQGLTRFLSRFHVRQHGEKTFNRSCGTSYITRRNYPHRK